MEKRIREGILQKIIRRLQNQSVFGYILAFSTVMVLIIGILGGYLYRFYYRTIYSDFLSSNRIQLSSLAERHENDMRVFDEIALEMGLSADIRAFRLDEQPEKSLKLKDRLYQYALVSQCISDIFYIYREDRYIYDYKTSADVERFFSDGILLDRTSEEEFREFLYREHKEMAALPEQDVDGYMTISFLRGRSDVVIYICPVVPKYYSNIAFVVGGSYYDDLLYGGEGQDRLNYLLYDGQLLVRRGMEGIGDGELPEEAKGMEDGQERVKIDGKEYLLSVSRGGSGILYCSLQSMEVFYDKIMNQQWGILLLLLTCSIPASCAVAVLGRTLSQKVKNINILLHDDEDSYYNLNRIENGIRLLQESSREAEKESAALRRTKFLLGFVRNEYKDRGSMEEMARKAELRADYRFFTVILMGDRGNSNEIKAHEKMLREVNRADGIDGYGMDLVSNNQRLFVLFADDGETLAQMEGTMFGIGREYCEEFLMAVSRRHERFEEASEAYLEADAAYDNRFLMDNGEIIRYENLAATKKINLLPEAYLKRLKNAIRMGEKEEAEGIVEEICQHVKKESYTLLAFRLLYNDIIHMLVSEWNIGETDFKDIYNVFTLSQCLTMQDFNDILRDVCRELMQVRQTGRKDLSELAERAVAYMKENFRNADLNMSALADYLEISPVTLAVEFKSGMGMSPSDYLTLIRMEYAKELLRNTDMRVKEVSMAVGYEDDHVFMRRFKKYAGKTPGQYRGEQ